MCIVYTTQQTYIHTDIHIEPATKDLCLHSTLATIFQLKVILIDYYYISPQIFLIRRLKNFGDI